MSLSGGDNVDIMSDMYYKFLVHDCMWSGACKEDNTHETTNKFSDFSYFSTSPVYGSIFDIFNIDDENSLGEINCDPEYDTSDQDDSPLSGLSPENTEPVDDENLLNPSCSSSPTPSTSSSISTLTGSTLISPTGLVSDASTSSTPITIIKPTTSRATSTGKSASTSKSTLSSKATKSSSKVKSTSTSNSRATTSTVAATSLVNPTISPSATVTTLINPNSSLINTNTTPSTTLGSSINSVSAIGTTTIGTPATIASAAVATAAGVASTTSILKTTGKARNSKSLYPERRKEHNNSEKKRRDHLRNAFNHLRDQIPKLKDGEKKAARVTILKESVSYVTLLKEKHRYLERTKNAETIKHENLLKRLKMLQSSTGASVDIKDPNIVYVQCNSSNVC